VVGSTKEQREVVADWLMVVGALALFVSLFLSWSHQFSPSFLAVWGTSDALRGVPRDPTAWQVYSSADVLLALLGVALIAVAVFGSRAARVAALVGALIALAFTIHALAVPPTNGANIFDPALSVPNYAPAGASAGLGETVALIALGMAIAGLGLSFTAD
jgi:hypothetical protein